MGRPKGSVKQPDKQTVVDGRNDPEMLIEEWLNGLAEDDIKVRVQRQDDEGNWVLVASKPKDAITDEWLLKRKPGRYRIRAVRPNGAIVGARNLMVDGDDQVEAGEPVPYSMPTDTNDKMFLMMQDANNKQHQMLMTLLTAAMSNKGSTFDPTAAMSAMVTGMASLKSMTETKGNGLEQVSQILDIAERVGGNGNGGSKSVTESLIEMAKDVLPAIMQARGLPPAEPLPKAQPIPVRQIPAESTLNLEIKLLWDKLLRAAGQDYDTQRTAGMMLDLEEFGDAAATVILDSIVKTPNFEEWQKQVGAIQETLKPWFSRLYQELRAMEGDAEHVGSGTTGTVEDDSIVKATAKA